MSRGRRQRGALARGRRVVSLAAILPIAALSPGLAQSEDRAEPRFFFGARADAVGSDGEPTNDMLGAGLTGRYRWSDRWSLVVALDHSPGFDVETPYDVLRLEAAEVDGEVIDAEGTATALVGWVERTYSGEGRRLEWFWGGGLGFATVDVDPIAGPLVGGGTFAIDQEVGTEFIAGLSGGFLLRMGERWRFVLGARLEQHFTDWKVVDRVSGRAGEFDDYLVKGVGFGFEVGF